MKKSMKRIGAALCLCVFGTMALGSGESDSEETKQIVTNGAAEETAATGEGTDTSAASEKSDTLDTSTASEDSASSVVSPNEEPSTDTVASTPATAIDEQVLVNQDGIVVTATEYVVDSIWGDGIKLLLENNSDKDVTVSCNALIVNDYMITDLFVSDIAAGKKANDTLDLLSSELKAAGIENVGKVEVYFHIYDSNTYNTIFDTDCITIQTSAYSNMDTTPNDTGVELYNQGGIRIVGKTVDENSFWGTAILLYAENNTDKNVGIRVEDMSINGFMMNPLYSNTIYSGKKSIDDITIFSSDLEENGIEAIEEVELQFHIYDSDTYSVIGDSEPITFSAQ